MYIYIYVYIYVIDTYLYNYLYINIIWMYQYIIVDLASVLSCIRAWLARQSTGSHDQFYFSRQN